MNKLNIGLFGFGCVGGGLYQVLNKSKLLNANIKKIVVKDPLKKRSIGMENFSFDANDILEDDEINLVVELIDDAEAAYNIVKKAIEKGKHVVTANKKMLALHLEELIKLKNKHKVSLLYEAAVCGSIPIIRNLEEYYNNDSLQALQAISNGTCNYILTRLDKEQKDFETILKDAQKNGFAESDPTLDIDGFDSNYKLSILLRHAFGLGVEPEEVLQMGIRHISPKDILFAKEKGYKIRLINYAQKFGTKVWAYVMPEFVSKDNFAYAVNYEFNAVILEASFSDKQVFIGKGAGSFPTASAVLSDISALQFDYAYEYKKKKSAAVSLEKDFTLKLYVSSADPKLIELLAFDEVLESYSSQDRNYKVGYIKRNKLSYDLYKNNPGLFIAVIN
jgi:homoserine dehydrogenase